MIRAIFLVLAALLGAAPASATEVRNLVTGNNCPALATPGEIGINRNAGLICYYNASGVIASASLLLATATGQAAVTAANAAALATAAGLGTTNTPTFAGITTTALSNLGGPIFVKSGTQFTGIHLQTAGGVNVGSIIGSNGSNGSGLLSLNDGAGATKFQVNAAGNSYITGGSLGIGTSSPGALLDVTGTMRGQFLTLSAAPTATNIPASYWTVVKRTDDGSVKLCANDGGTVKCSVALQ